MEDVLKLNNRENHSPEDGVTPSAKAHYPGLGHTTIIHQQSNFEIIVACFSHVVNRKEKEEETTLLGIGL